MKPLTTSSLLFSLNQPSSAWIVSSGATYPQAVFISVSLFLYYYSFPTLSKEIYAILFHLNLSHTFFPVAYSLLVYKLLWKLSLQEFSRR